MEDKHLRNPCSLILSPDVRNVLQLQSRSRLWGHENMAKNGPKALFLLGGVWGTKGGISNCSLRLDHLAFRIRNNLERKSVDFKRLLQFVFPFLFSFFIFFERPPIELYVTRDIHHDPRGQDLCLQAHYTARLRNLLPC